MNLSLGLRYLTQIERTLNYLNLSKSTAVPSDAAILLDQIEDQVNAVRDDLTRQELDLEHRETRELQNKVVILGALVMALWDLTRQRGG